MLGNIRHVLAPLESRKAKVTWIQEKAKEHGKKLPALAFLIIARTWDAFLTEIQVKESYASLADDILEEHVRKRKKPSSALKEPWFPLQSFFLVMSSHPHFATLKKEITLTLIAEADKDKTHDLKQKIVQALVSWEPEVIAGDEGPESRNVPVVNAQQREANEERFEMSKLLPALKRWHKETWLDQETAQALDVLT